ncbi:seed trypsin/chymotrypsin inhibitor TI5-72-like [Macadamia integrifolia]|uniref:seed trypsin/chymotrypsin inhibitor TI5-72-like n=1 Tax=Macadamia integrifolia TaxID=60698 RepID=UPI001C4E8869|nr:seed trypsin/chymotrypsin inhibitor TI5-72-like [Macadamia integrifolia]XP_042482597.1 seed trypsin/chymotrypsin inhibitor TI5-72-like [Macadamia integrifolia]
MALKVVLMTVMLLFSLATMPAPMAATRVDVAKLLAAIDIPTGKKTGGSSWCDSCVCTKSSPPYCSCTDTSLCTKCICYLTVSAALLPLCESIASQFDSYCLSTVTTAERNLASLR